MKKSSAILGGLFSLSHWRWTFQWPLAEFEPRSLCCMVWMEDRFRSSSWHNATSKFSSWCKISSSHVISGPLGSMAWKHGLKGQIDEPPRDFRNVDIERNAQNPRDWPSPNSEVLMERIETDRELLKTVKRRKIGYLGHFLRGESYKIWYLNIQKQRKIPKFLLLFSGARTGDLLLTKPFHSKACRACPL